MASGAATAATGFTRARRGFARPLSRAERWFWMIDAISPANCVARVRVHGVLTPERLEAAADTLVSEYPVLQAAVRGPADDPWLASLAEPVIPVRRIASDDPHAWQREVEAELARPFDVRAGLSRIAVVAGRDAAAGEFHDVILTMSRIIGDGRSSLAALRELIEAAAGAPPRTPRTPIPPANELIRIPPRGFWRCLFTKPHGRTRIVYRVLDAERLAALAADCHRAGVTVHSALVDAVDGRVTWNTSVIDPGRVEMPEQAGTVRLSGVALAASNSGICALTVTATAAHGELRLGFCYAEGVLTAAQAAAFADHTIAKLLEPR